MCSYSLEQVPFIRLEKRNCVFELYENRIVIIRDLEQGLIQAQNLIGATRILPL
jgi:hypothetical protein